MPPARGLPADDPRTELVRRLQVAWNRGDLEHLVGREFHGRDAIRAFFEDFGASFGELHIEVEQAIPAGPRILLILNQDNRGETGGVATSNRWAQLLSFSDRLIIRAENYYEVDEGLRAIRAR